VSFPNWGGVVLACGITELAKRKKIKLKIIEIC
jgi:hypothetical protein